jgi:putative spermidine/putrescine transport system permease protein
MWDDALLKVSPTLAAVSTVLIVFVAVTIWLAERLRQGAARA